MYVEILHEVVKDILTKEKDKKQPITITLTPFLYDTFQHEINHICIFNTEVPIEGANFTSLVIYGRTITLECTDKLDSRIEMKLVEKLTQLAFKK